LPPAKRKGNFRVGNRRQIARPRGRKPLNFRRLRSALVNRKSPFFLPANSRVFFALGDGALNYFA